MFETSRQGAVDIIRGDGLLNLQTAQEASDVFEKYIQQGQPRIVFDLHKIVLIDSAGLELLLDIRDQCLQRGGELKLSAPSSLCQEIFELTDVCSQIDIFDDAVTAAGSFAQ